MKGCKEVYNRSLNAGDYFLFCLFTWHFSTVAIGKVFNDGVGYIYYNNSIVPCDAEILVKKANVDIKNGCKVYKLSGDTALFERYWQNGRNLDEFMKGDYLGDHWENSEKMRDILQRPLSVGDFVMYTKRNQQMTKRGIEYGIILDKTHILAYPDKIKTVRLVYKVTDRTAEEDVLYKEISSNYRQRQTNVLKGTSHTENHVGDVYRKNNVSFIYLGKYMFKLIASSTGNILKYDYAMLCYKDKINKPVNLYLRVNLATNRGQNLIEKFRVGDYSDLREYIEEKTSSSTIPKNIVLDLSKIKLGTYLESLDFSKVDSSVLNSIKHIRPLYGVEFIKLNI